MSDIKSSWREVCNSSLSKAQSCNDGLNCSVNRFAKAISKTLINNSNVDKKYESTLTSVVQAATKLSGIGLLYKLFSATPLLKYLALTTSVFIIFLDTITKHEDPSEHQESNPKLGCDCLNSDKSDFA